MTTISDKDRAEAQAIPATACGRQQPDSPGPALTPTPTLGGRQNRDTGRTAMRPGNRESECPACAEWFASHTAGDLHRVFRLARVQPGEARDGWRVASTANRRYRCLTADEMHAKGWRQDTAGRWKLPGTWKPNTESETP